MVTFHYLDYITFILHIQRVRTLLQIQNRLLSSYRDSRTVNNIFKKRNEQINNCIFFPSVTNYTAVESNENVMEIYATIERLDVVSKPVLKEIVGILSKELNGS